MAMMLDTDCDNAGFEHIVSRSGMMASFDHYVEMLLSE